MNLGRLRLIFIALLTYIAPSQLLAVVSPLCEKYKENDTEYQECYTKLAIDKNDGKVCQILNSYYRDECIADFVEVSNEYLLCKKIKDFKRREWCFYNASKVLKEPEICTLMDKTFLADECWVQSAMGQNDSSFCENIELKDHSDVCYGYVARFSQSRVLCDEIANPWLRLSCQSDLGDYWSAESSTAYSNYEDSFKSCLAEHQAQDNFRDTGLVKIGFHFNTSKSQVDRFIDDNSLILSKINNYPDLESGLFILLSYKPERGGLAAFREREKIAESLVSLDKNNKKPAIRWARAQGDRIGVQLFDSQRFEYLGSLISQIEGLELKKIVHPLFVKSVMVDVGNEAYQACKFKEFDLVDYSVPDGEAIKECSSEERERGIFEVNGTVKQLDFEGGFFGIVSDDGESYDVSDIPKRFQKDGLKVTVKLRVCRNVAGIRMWGRIAHLFSISERSL